MDNDKTMKSSHFLNLNLDSEYKSEPEDSNFYDSKSEKDETISEHKN